MSNTLLMGQYLETHSIFHRLDPRTKLVSMIIIMLSFLMLDTFVSYVVATFFWPALCGYPKSRYRSFGEA